MKPKNEENDCEKHDNYKVKMTNTICISIIVVSSLLCVFWFFLAPVDLAGHLDCTTGDVDLKASFHNEVQNKSCEKTSLIDGEYYIIKTNETCFKQEWVGERIDFAGVKNLRCRGSYKMKAPFLMTLRFFN